MIFALGRAGVLPGVLGRIHPAHRTPHVAILLQTALNVAVSMTLGFWLGPINALNFIGVLIAIGIILIYMLANASVISLVWLRHGRERSTVRHLLVPVAAITLLAVALFYTVWPTPPPPVDTAEAFVAVWLLIGACVAVFSRGRFRDALERAASIMVGENSEDSESTAPVTAPQPGLRYDDTDATERTVLPR